MLLDLARRYRRLARDAGNPRLFGASIEIDGRRWVQKTWKRANWFDYYDGIGILWVQIGRYQIRLKWRRK